jgi:hypothetical protein
VVGLLFRSGRRDLRSPRRRDCGWYHATARDACEPLTSPPAVSPRRTTKAAHLGAVTSCAPVASGGDDDRRADAHPRRDGVLRSGCATSSPGGSRFTSSRASPTS